MAPPRGRRPGRWLGAMFAGSLSKTNVSVLRPWCRPVVAVVDMRRSPVGACRVRLAQGHRTSPCSSLHSVPSPVSRLPVRRPRRRSTSVSVLAQATPTLRWDGGGCVVADRPRHPAGRRRDDVSISVVRRLLQVHPAALFGEISEFFTHPAFTGLAQIRFARVVAE